MARGSVGMRDGQKYRHTIRCSPFVAHTAVN
jgi:hypothetical protein